MEYVFKDERTRQLFEDDKTFRKSFGVKGIKARDNRLNEIDAASDLADLLKFGRSGPGRWHVLDNREGGHDEGKISGDITGKYRMLLAPSHESFGTVTEVEICEIKDTH